MKTRIVLIALAIAAALPAYAGEKPLAMLAQISGLSERKVNMILGNRTSFAEYPYTYDRALQKFQAAVGKDNHQRLLNGETIALQYQGKVHLVSLTRTQVGKAL